MSDPKDDGLVDDEGGEVPIYGGSVIPLACLDPNTHPDMDEDVPSGRPDRKLMRSVNVSVSMPGLPDIPEILVYLHPSLKCPLCWDRVDVLVHDPKCYPIKGSHNVPFEEMPQFLSGYFAQRLEKCYKSLDSCEVEATNRKSL